MPPNLRMRLERSARASHRTLSAQMLFLLQFGLRELEQQQPGLSSTRMEGESTRMRDEERL
jgi:hypothetical protein